MYTLFLDEEVEIEAKKNLDLYIIFRLLNGRYDSDEPLNNPDYIETKKKTEKYNLIKAKEILDCLKYEFGGKNIDLLDED